MASQVPRLSSGRDSSRQQVVPETGWTLTSLVGRVYISSRTEHMMKGKRSELLQMIQQMHIVFVVFLNEGIFFFVIVSKIEQ